MSEPATVAGVLVWVVRHPWAAIGRRWNYKAAILSALVRGALFFAVNARAGADAAAAALLTEAVFRLGASGFYGALTQAFRCAQPKWAATAAVLVLLPVVSHSLELVVHWWRGTPELIASIVASVALTTVSTAFNLFAMRRGILVVGATARTLLDDLRAMPRLIVLFVTSFARRRVRA